MNCDEYPFASTYQGAYFQTNAGGRRRPFSWCQVTPTPPAGTGPLGWSVCMIDGQQNQVGGIQLGNFYNQSRVLDGERFQVRITA